MSPPHQRVSLLRLLPLACLLAAPAAWGGRPFTTEDGSVIPKGACELETFLARSPAVQGAASESAYWVQAGCGVGGGTQLALGSGRARSDGERSRGVAIVGKTMLMRSGSDDAAPVWTVAYVLNGVKPDGRSLRRSAHSAQLVHTRAIGRGLIHANLGWSHDRLARQDSTTWALAYERPDAFARWDLGAEAFGDDREPAFAGLVARWKLGDSLNLDASWARQLGGSHGTTYTLGLKLAW